MSWPETLILNSAKQAPSVAQRVTRSNIMEEQIFGTVQAQAQNANDFTYHMTVVVPTDCTEVQAVLDNVSLTLPFRIKKAIVATSDTVGPDPTFGTTTNQVRFTPQNGQAWKDLTWDSGVANVEIATAPGTARKRRKATDFVVAPTVANVDGSKRRVYMFRFLVEGTTNSPGNGYCLGAYPMTWRSQAANTSLHKGFLWQCIRYTGDGVTNPATFQPTTDLSALPFLTCIRFKTRTPGVTINMLGGDSITAGAVNGAAGNFGNGWMWQLVNALRDMYPNVPISMSNNGFPSTGTAIFYQNALDYLDAGAVVGLPFYQPITQNDGVPTKAQYDVALGRMATVCNRMQERNKSVVIVGPVCNTSLAWTAPQDAVRTAFRQDLVAMETAGLLTLFDMEAVSDGASPARYKSGKSDDMAHPNESGCADLVSSNVAKVAPLIG